MLTILSKNNLADQNKYLSLKPFNGKMIIPSVNILQFYLKMSLKA